MQQQMCKPIAQVLYNMARHGLLHQKRICTQCNYPMSMYYEEETNYKHIWKCTFCFRHLPVNYSTPLCTLNLRRFDIALECWIMNAKSISTAKLMTTSSSVIGHSSPEYFNVFRKVASHYVDNKILPYLVLPGPIEIDESKTQNKKFKVAGGTIVVRWVFGMYCRSTKLAVIYCIKDKTHETLVECMKKHIPRGGIIFSDSHMAYCNLPAARSKLTQYGYYHFWTNHSFRMVHEKFPFNNSLYVERMWRSLKMNCYQIKSSFNYAKVQQHANSFMLKRKLVRKRLLYDFMLKATYEYYRDKYNEFLRESQYEEQLCPSIYKIDEIMLNLQSQKRNNFLKRTIKASKVLCNWNFFVNIDLEDLRPCKDDNQFDRNFLKYYEIGMSHNKVDRWVQKKQGYNQYNSPSTSHQPKIQFRHRFSSRENWVPVWPQLDQIIDPEEDRLRAENEARGKEKRDGTYDDVDVCSLKRSYGERDYYRALKLQWYEGQLNMYLYEHTEQSMDMWHRDQVKYNTKKFNADIDLLDLELSEEENSNANAMGMYD